MGYEKGFPRDIAHAHQDFGGLHLPHLYSEMSAMKLEALISHIRADSALGKALMININTIQLISGSYLPILENNCNLNYLDDNWIMHLRTFVFEINASVKIENIWRPMLQKENDICLMDIFCTHTNFTSRQLTLVNYWRIYYQVIFLSDICEPGDENKVQVCFTKENANMDLKMQQSCLHWPNQQKPGKKGFQLWISCLKQCFEFNKSNRKISWKLGKWLPHHISYNKWNYYFDADSQHVYQANATNYTCYGTINSKKHTSIYNNIDIINSIIDIPTAAIPAQVISQNRISKCIHSSTPSNTTTTTERPMDTIPLTWKEYISNLSDWQQQFLKHTKIHDHDIMQASLSNSAHIMIINDGGTMITNQGTFGSVLSNGDEAIFSSHGKCYNNHFYMSSYRSESQAILSGLLSLYHLRKFLAITTATNQDIKIYCDNKKLIRNIKHYMKYHMTVNDHNKPDFDIIIEIMMLIKEFRNCFNTISIHYVKSKKADDDSESIISHETQMHRLAHILAQQAKAMRDVQYIPMPHNRVNFTINDYYVNANVCKVAKKCYSSINARRFLQAKYNWDDITTDNIWWNVHAKSLQKLELHNRIRINKFIHNHCSTNSRDHLHYKHKLEVCNMCSHSEETENHILQCPTYPRRKMRKLWIKEILDIDKKIIPLNIRKAISLGIKGWLEKSPINDEMIDSFSNKIQQAFRHQSRIGWDHFVRGRLSITWGILINETITKQDFDAEKWGTKIIDINFKYLILLWEHRCLIEHGTTDEEQESKLKTKLLNEIMHMQQTSHPRNDNDAKIIHHDFEALRKLNSNQLQDWIVGARIIYTICKQKISNSSMLFTDAAMCQEIEVDPG